MVDEAKHASSTATPSRSAIGRVSGVMAKLFAGRSTVQATGRFLRQQLWAWPIIAAVLFGGAGWWAHFSLEGAMRQQRVNDLTAMADASAKAVNVWIAEEQVNVRLIADDERLGPLVSELLKLSDGSPDAEGELVRAKAQRSLRARLKRKLDVCGYVGYFVVSPQAIVIAADQDMPVGKPVPAERRPVFEQAVAGKTLMSKPFRSTLLLADEKGELRANLPTMFVVGPLHDEHGKPIAALGLRIRPEHQFTRILQAVRFGESGETYAFDKNGLLLSQSRFDDDLKRLGLLVDQPDAQSILTIEVRDPQVNMAEGERPKLRRAEQPLTLLAAAAVRGENGHDADGYRDYRGVPSIGAWRWLPEHDFGIGTEVDVAEAFRLFYLLRRAFWTLIALLILSAVGIFCAMLFMAKQQRALQEATLAAKQLGQYTLEEKLGAGGMGTVYKAHHAMLRRPTAVKLLNLDKVSDAALARFEREVQHTSALTHPNTVAVFDYGRTPDGIFYYAMEYLDGLNLDDFVKRFGPLSEARMVFILKQICGSLAEAHALGMVHRDIKPANIFLTQRGGMRDFVKVLDFGLVKSVGGADQANVTNPNAMIGTPYYLSPEGVNHPDSVDARADVYAVGAVAYFLLTGEPVFTGTNIMDICMQHVKTPPRPPSERCGKPLTPALEAFILRCLAKSPNDRPANAAQILVELEACNLSQRWTAVEAAYWWHRQEHPDSVKDPAMETTRVLAAPSPNSTAAYDGNTGD